MPPTLLEEAPLTLPTTLGPYRRRDYEALPDEPRCELIYGRFFVSPSPFLLHQIVLIHLSRYFLEIAEAAGGLAVAAPMDVHLFDHSVVQPDILYVSRANRGILQRWVEGAPDLVVEVLSPGTARRDRGEKLRLYAESGVREYWLVDCEARQIEHLVARDGAMVVTLPEGAIYRSPVLPEVEIDLAAFWGKVERQLAP